MAFVTTESKLEQYLSLFYTMAIMHRKTKNHEYTGISVVHWIQFLYFYTQQ